MNLVVVARAAAGLARYLNEHGGGAVVVGHDARHDSDLFARATAQILSGAGLSVMMLPAHLPTPVLAFAVRHLGCAAGVMVTASHNPPADNGYKVYLGDGSQIVSPVDREISAHIADVTALGPVADLPHGDEWVTLGDEVVQAYVDKAAALVEDGPTAAHPPRLHGDARRRRRGLPARAGAGRVPRARRRGRAVRARRRLPDGLLPQPRGAGRDGPRARRRAASPTATS